MSDDLQLRCPECGITVDDPRKKFCPQDGSSLIQLRFDDDPLTGRLIDDRYRIVQKIGSGGMGAVYRAEQLGMKREVALKVLRAEVADDSSVQARFTREARSASQVDSPHVVTLFDYGKTKEGLFYIAMELLKGSNLTEHVSARGGSLDWGEATRIGCQIARGLSAAHSAGVAHRDLKPDNVHVDARDGSVKVLDFGIAKIIDHPNLEIDSGPVTIAGTILGTPAYMSPEAAARSGKVGIAADLYALGNMLFEMMVGRTVFEETEPVLLLGMHLRVEPERLREARPDLVVPDELEQLVDQMLEKDPERRPTADEVVIVLEELLKAGDHAEPRSAPTHPTTPLTDTSRPGLRWGLPLLGALAVLAITVVGATIFFDTAPARQDPPTEPEARPSFEAVAASTEQPSVLHVDAGQEPRAIAPATSSKKQPRRHDRAGRMSSVPEASPAMMDAPEATPAPTKMRSAPGLVQEW